MAKTTSTPDFDPRIDYQRYREVADPVQHLPAAEYGASLALSQLLLLVSSMLCIWLMIASCFKFANGRLRTRRIRRSEAADFLA